MNQQTKINPMKKLLLSLSLLAVLPLAARANYCAYALSTSSSSFGAYGFAYNYRTASSAVNAAVNYMPGYSPYSYRYWNNRGYSAFARGFSSSGRGFQSGYGRGYGSSSAAVNGAISAIPRAYRYSLGYTWGYNY